MARALVSGGCGYLGERLCSALLREGHSVVVVDNLSTGDPSVLQRLREGTAGCGISLEEVDCCDESAMDAVFREHRPDIGFHLAAYVDVAESVRAPETYYRNNLGATIGFLSGARKSGCSRLVFSSSASVYGPSSRPVTENSALSPSSPYAYSKAVSERIFADIASVTEGARVTILRYFNPVGSVPSRTVALGRNEIASLALFPRICRVLEGIEPVLDVFEPYDRTAGDSCVRDFVHIDDLVSAHIAVLSDRWCRQSSVEIFNVGRGEGHSVNEVISTFEMVVGKRVYRRRAPSREGDIAYSVADVSRIQAAVGWRATRDLEEMCRDTWDDYSRLARATGRM